MKKQRFEAYEPDTFEEFDRLYDELKGRHDYVAWCSREDCAPGTIIGYSDTTDDDPEGVPVWAPGDLQ